MKTPRWRYWVGLLVLGIPSVLLTARWMNTYGLVGGIGHYVVTTLSDPMVSLDILLHIALLVVVAGWLIPDARARGWNGWPWVALCFLTSVLGLLLYLAVRPEERKV